jgi:hypothetical protein
VSFAAAALASTIVANITIIIIIIIIINISISTCMRVDIACFTLMLASAVIPRLAALYLHQNNLRSKTQHADLRFKTMHINLSSKILGLRRVSVPRAEPAFTFPTLRGQRRKLVLWTHQQNRKPVSFITDVAPASSLGFIAAAEARLRAHEQMVQRRVVLTTT